MQKERFKMKKGPLSKAEKYCINTMSSEGEDVEAIGEFLERSEDVVSKHLESQPAPEKPKGKKNTTQFIKETAEKGNKGVSIMTGHQSAKSDDLRSIRAEHVAPHTKKTIHKISEDG
jgi:hypothetical protein|tara:strand:- start:2520 stop:2870 length:351 start_codon:yes stop_codon:yes gene_type:complete